MANWWESIELPLSAEGRTWAAQITAAYALCADRKPNPKATRFWSAAEIDLFGYYAEWGFAAYLGELQRLAQPSSIRPGRNDGYDDLPGLGVSIKCAPWAGIEHFHLCDGGRLLVPLAHAKVTAYVLCTYFLRSARLFFDGWVTRAQVLQAPRYLNRARILTAAIPYAQLLPPHHYPADIPAWRSENRSRQAGTPT